MRKFIYGLIILSSVVTILAFAQEWRAVVFTPPGTDGVSQTRTLKLGPGLIVDGDTIKTTPVNEIKWGLPPGVTLSGNGVLSGTPTQAGKYLFELQVTDANGVTASKLIMITIAEKP